MRKWGGLYARLPCKMQYLLALQLNRYWLLDLQSTWEESLKTNTASKNKFSFICIITPFMPSLAESIPQSSESRQFSAHFDKHLKCYTLFWQFIVLLSSSRYVCKIVMLTLDTFPPYSAGVDFRHQNLTSVVCSRTERVTFCSGRRPITYM